MSSPLPPPPPLPPPVAPAGRPGSLLPQGVTVASPGQRLLCWLLEIVLSIATLGIGWLIWAAMIVGSGQTPAKRLMNQRVVGASSLQPVGFSKMVFMRGIVAGFVSYFAILFTLGVLLFMPLWDRRKQNIWDKVSHTYVVHDPFDAWNTRPNL
jgi:uncharacterized RDD family membrane protein YckC